MEKKEVIAISPSSSEKEESPLRSMVCLKRDMDMKQFEEKADCFILDFDPFDSIGFTSLSVPENVDGDNGDVSIIGEKGQVACRDYPHPRHLCLKYPFGDTPCEKHCELCCCYVCDTAAPCGQWTEPGSPHCRASDHSPRWKLQRLARKGQPGAPQLSPPQ